MIFTNTFGLETGTMQKDRECLSCRQLQKIKKMGNDDIGRVCYNEDNPLITGLLSAGGPPDGTTERREG